MDKYALGVDIGGTTVKLGLFLADGTLCEKWEIPTRTEDRGGHILPDVAASIRAALERRSIAWEQAAGIGIGVPGPVDGQNTVFKCVNLGWGVLNVKEEMNRLLPEIPRVSAANDANAAALGELWKGGGMGYHSAVMVTLGTGVGGGVALDGQIVAGAHGGAGEIGHMTVEPLETVPCSCGKRGCLEQYASANGIVRMGRQMLADCAAPSALRRIEPLTARDICDQARAGDEMALRILDRCADYLGRALSFVSCAIDPDVFVIGGGMSRAGDILLSAMKAYHKKYAFHVSADTPMTLARLGNDAGICGCARMVLR